jgi:ATP-dependent RNA helicase RhlE
VPIPPQERMLRDQGVELLIATPGRLLDLQGRQSLALDEIEILILDEADRMVDMGFAPDLRRILRLLPANRQTLMFSATMPAELNRVASEALKNPKRLDMGPSMSRPAPRIAQSAYMCPKASKPALLEKLLDTFDDHTAIVFTRTKHGADRLARRLKTAGHNAAPIHGDRSQGQRERALRDFKNGRVTVLVATDIASRGIDVDDVTHVINFDVPRAPEDYVHRIGRTGRMDAEGEAITFVSPDESKDFAAIENVLGKKVPRKTLDGFDAREHRDPPRSADHGSRDGGSGRRDGGNGRGGSDRGRREGPPGRGRYAGERAQVVRDDYRPGDIRGRRSEGSPSSDSGERRTPEHASGSHAGSPARPHSQPVADTHGRRPRSGANDRRSRRKM